MNRKQRRANKQKNSEPTFTVKQSDLKSHFDRVLNSAEVQEAIREEARRVSREEAKQSDLDILTLILLSLHRGENFGRKKLLRFCHNFNDLQKYYAGLFEEDDLYAMRLHLKNDVGIDVERINEEVEKFLNENPNER